MKVLTLNGASILPLIDGRIGHLFPGSRSPFSPVWNRRNVLRLCNPFQGEEYIVVGFSAGATAAHYLGQADRLCRGVVAHSGKFPRRLSFQEGTPTLLLYNTNDIFPTQVHAYRTANAFRVNGLANDRLLVTGFRSPAWHGHTFTGVTYTRWWVEYLTGSRIAVA